MSQIWTSLLNQMKIKNTLLLLCLCSTVFSETYICTTTINGDSSTDSFQRKGNKFELTRKDIKLEIIDEVPRTKIHTVRETLEIIYEKKDILILGLRGDRGMEFHYIHKKYKHYYVTYMLDYMISRLNRNLEGIARQPVGKVLIIDD